MEALSGLCFWVRLLSSPFWYSLNTSIIGLLECCGSIMAGHPRFAGGFILPLWLRLPLDIFSSSQPVLPSGAKIRGCLVNPSCITDSCDL